MINHCFGDYLVILIQNKSLYKLPIKKNLFRFRKLKKQSSHLKIKLRLGT